MLDLRFVRDNKDRVEECNRQRGVDLDLNEFIQLDSVRRDLLQEAETLKFKRNTVSEEIALLKKEKKDASSEIAAMREVSLRIKELDNALSEKEQLLNQMLLNMPNIPHSSVKEGRGEDDNPEIRR